MIYAYIRVSSDKQTVKNQRFEILNYADSKKVTIGEWIEETISSRKKLADRLLGKTLGKLQKGDLLLVAELSRLGRNLMEVMGILHQCMEKEVEVHTIKEKYQLGNNINSKILAFAFSLSAEIERQLISQRTKEALARKKSEGKKLGRPKGALSKKTKLTGKEEEIRQLRTKGIGYSTIAKIMDVNRLTVKRFIQNHNLEEN